MESESLNYQVRHDYRGVLHCRIPLDRRFDILHFPEPNSGCWIWLGALDAKGYGSISVNGKNLKAHRWAYEHFIGPIPVGLVPDHLCHLPCCVNPWHMEPVTHQVNILRGQGIAAIRAKQTHCIHGHELAGDNLLSQSRRGRQCKLCHRKITNRARDKRKMFEAQYGIKVNVLKA